uniref:NAD(P)H-quinone oxidoreductase subunit M, chloroplastic n=1 Tax=Pelargonium nanum TaxID=59882 RepID=A0A0F7CYX5_9ROSI
MTSTSSCMASTKFSMPGWSVGAIKTQVAATATARKRFSSFSVSAQQQPASEVQEDVQQPEEQVTKPPTKPRPVEPQVNVKSKNMTREYGGQWLSSTTRHVRIFAAYIDPETYKFDQTQMDKLTLILDPTDEFLWTDETTTKIFSYFQELVDHYEGAPLTEYTLRLIGSDIEHRIRKMLYDGEIKYNMNAKTLNFSMGKPRVQFNDIDVQPQDV